jgi:hypothetical protein
MKYRPEMCQEIGKDCNNAATIADQCHSRRQPRTAVLHHKAHKHSLLEIKYTVSQAALSS